MQAGRGNIAVVEDDVGLNHAIARLLRIAGFESSSFASAEQLLASDSVLRADCFVLDIHLPGISGLDLHRRLDDSGIVRPVIFITAHDDFQTRRAERVGVSCLTKPFTGRALIQAIDAALMNADVFGAASTRTSD